MIDSFYICNNPIRMPFFSTRLKTSSGSLNFYFNCMVNVEGERYQVYVVRKDLGLQSFIMVHNTEKWTMLDPHDCPAWIIEFEDQLSQAIEQHQPEFK